MQGVLPVQMLCSCCNNFANGRNCFAGPALHPMPCELLCLCCTHSLTSLGLEYAWFAITENSVTDKIINRTAVPRQDYLCFQQKEIVVKPPTEHYMTYIVFYKTVLLDQYAVDSRCTTSWIKGNDLFVR